MTFESPKSRVYWTVGEAATYLGVHQNTLWRWAGNTLQPAKKKKRTKFGIPEPPCIRLGRMVRFPIEEFKAWAKTPTNGQQKAKS